MPETPEPAPAAAIPPGWYNDSTESGPLRWWSGVEWTEHTSPVYAGATPARPALPADRPVYSVFIWLIVLMPLAIYGLFFAWQPDFGALSNPRVTVSLTWFLTPGYFAIIVGSWLVYGLSALFAWRDVVWLRSQGVVRPFAWPWIFLYSPVYIIGRSVIVHQVAKPRGLRPIWVYIAVIVAGLVVSIAWTFLLFSSMVAHLSDMSGGYPS